jgi:hypothetical protein
MTTFKPGDRPERPEDETSTATPNRVVVIAVAAALVAGAVAGLAIGRLTAGQASAQGGNTSGQDVEAMRTEIEQLTSEAEEREAEVDRLTADADGHAEEVTGLTTELSERDAEVDEMTEEIAALEGQLEALEAEKVTLQEQLDQVINPPLGPSPTAELRVSWVRRENFEDEVVACVQIKNTSTTDLDFYYSYAQFSAFDGDNSVYPPVSLYAGQIDFPMADGQLGPGEARRGKLLYEVPSGSRLTRLLWTTGFEDTPEISVDVHEDRFWSDHPYIARC